MLIVVIKGTVRTRDVESPRRVMRIVYDVVTRENLLIHHHNRGIRWNPLLSATILSSLKKSCVFKAGMRR